MNPLPTVAKLRADIEHHRTWWPSNPLDELRGERR